MTWKQRALIAENEAAVLLRYLPGTPRWQPQVERWRSLVARYFKPADVDLAMALIRCESVGDPVAVCGKDWTGTPPPGYDGTAETRASGLFQHVPAYWPSRSRAAGWEGHSIFEPEANVAVAAWLVYDNWQPASAPHWHHWSGAQVGKQGCLEWAQAQIGV